MNRKDLQELSAMRRREAKRLLDARCFDGAYYLAGYVVELALKACIAKSFKRHAWPDKDFVKDIHTHDLETLLNKAELKPTLEQDMRSNPNLRANWQTVKDWKEVSRYQFRSELQARDLYRAVTARKYGVLSWIKRHW